MRLIRCYVENFGKLSNLDISFQDELNIFVQENGWGKSTLSVFLTVMFYGFENERKRTVLEKEREKYRPWQGGEYGGEVVFFYNEKEYRIERRFGEREKEDSIRIYEELTGLETQDFSENIGEELFGLDRFSFQKSIYIVQNQCKMETTDMIHAKLGNPLERVWDLEQYSNAQRMLEKEINRLNPVRKNSEIGKIDGTIEQLSYKLLQIQRSLEGENKLMEQLQLWKKKRDYYQEEQVQLQKKLYQRKQNKEHEQIKVRYLELCEKEKEREQRLEALETNFVNGIPCKEEVMDMLVLAENEMRNQIILEQSGLSKEEEEAVSWVQEKWNSEIPSEHEVKECMNWIQQMAKEQQAEEASQIVVHYKKSVITEKERKQVFRIGILCFILGILLFLVTKLWGGILIGISVLCLVLGFRGGERKKTYEPKTEETKEKINYSGLITQFLEKYPVYESADWGKHIECIIMLNNNYHLGITKKKKLESTLLELQEHIRKLDEFFVKYGMEKQEKSSMQLHNILMKLENYQIAEADYTEANREKLEYKKQYFDILEQPETENGPSEQWKEKWEISIEGFEKASRELQEITEQLEHIYNEKALADEYKSQIARLTEERIQKEKKYILFKKTSEYLQRAKENFVAKYRTPMEKGVEKYYGYLTGEKATIQIDANLKLKKREKGLLRDLPYFSQGWQDLFGICLRIALADAMYPAEKPFFILDDPFVNLDDEKIKGGMELLAEISKEYQIIYFTCHGSRA